MAAAQILIRVLEDAVNRLLRMDPDSLRGLGALSGRVIELELADLGVSIFLFPSEAGVHARTSYADVPDVVLRGRLSGFLNLALGQEMRAFFSGGLEVSGDVDLGQRFQKILQQLDIDWEEQTARLLGDPLAHQLGNGVRAARAWTVASGALIARDLTEYLQCEARLLPQRHEVEVFLDAVDALRADVDRMEQRIARLRRELESQEAP